MTSPPPFKEASMTPLPAAIAFGGSSYPFKKLLGQGGSGSVGLYGNEKTGYLALKVSYCGDPKALEKSQKETNNAAALVAMPDCLMEDVFWRRNAPFKSSDMLRSPLSTLFLDGCSYALYVYAPENLAEWLQSNPYRTPEQVTAIFLQIVSILRCLRRRGYHYNDLKPSNLFVWPEASGVPRVKIGDLGGLDRLTDEMVTVTPSRLPPKLLKNISRQHLDVLTDFLLGELLLQLLFRAPVGGETHPMNDFLRCLHRDAPDHCTQRALTALRHRLAPGLSLQNQQVRDMAALALNFMGFKGWYLSLAEALKLDTPLFT
jgi:serine/threonine protein kinase